MQALFQQDLCPPTINQGSHKPGHIQECGPDPSHSTSTTDLLWEPDLTLSGRKWFLGQTMALRIGAQFDSQTHQNSTGVGRCKSKFEFQLMWFWKLFILLDFFFYCIFLSRHTPQELKSVQKRVVSHGRNQQKTPVCTCQDALWAQMCCELSWQFHLLVFHARLCRVCRRSAGTGRVITRRDWSGGVVKHKKGEGEKQLSFAKISAASGASQTGLKIKTSQLWDFSFHQASFCCAVPCQSLCGVDWAMHF